MPPTCPIYTQESSDALAEELRAKVKQMRAAGMARSEEGRKELGRTLSKLYYHENRELVRQRELIRRKKRSEELRATERWKKREYKRLHPSGNLWSCVKYRAKREGMDFDIAIDDLVIPKFCPYLGIELTSEKGEGHLDNLMSVDRINPKLGYIKGNVEVISYKANRMKNDASAQELVAFAESILRRFKK